MLQERRKSSIMVMGSGKSSDSLDPKDKLVQASKDTAQIASQNPKSDFLGFGNGAFDQEQIQSFVGKWFVTKNSNLDKRFAEQLQENPSIYELASSPILLTLLCIEFEDAGDFPKTRSELYQRATNTLLRKWDAKRGIKRDVLYQS
jgi:predicted NACHT family NTPase